MASTTKRFIDVIGSLVFLLIMGLPIILISLLVKISSKGPVFFNQERVGKGGSLFTLFKFRSMKYDDEEKNLFHCEERVTRIGKILRKWRMDEIPQMLNVLLGDMSIVGPRPTLPYQVEKYDQEQKKRLLVKPGITGWAQIHGDEAITWPDRISLDIWYIDNWSILLDLKIMILTPLALLKIRKINVEEGPPEDGISGFQNPKTGDGGTR